MVLMPLPGSRIIPAAWNEHHRPTASASLNGTCVIDRTGAPANLDSATLQYGTATSTRIWSGPCRVQALARAERHEHFGELAITTRRFRVVVDWDATDLRVDDIVTITGSQDPDLSGRRLRVLEVGAGTEEWERDLTCEDWQK